LRFDWPIFAIHAQTYRLTNGTVLNYVATALRPKVRIPLLKSQNITRSLLLNMNQPHGISFVVPLSREEWGENLERSIEIGLAQPGETYEQYLDSIRRDPRYVLCTPHDL
jgi:hypothetical protein